MPATIRHARRPRRVRGGHLLGISAELHRLATPAVALTIAACLAIEAATTLLTAGHSAVRAGPPAAVLQCDTLTGALRISAMHTASLCGLLLAAALATAGTAGDYEAGAFGLLLLAEPRRAVLFTRKLVAGALMALGVTFLGAVLIRLCGVVIRSRYGEWAAAPGPSWMDAATTTAHAGLVLATFLAVATACAAIARSPLGTLAAFLGPMFALAPATRTGLAPFLPHYWVSGWMGFDRAEQFQTYLWNGASSQASVLGCGTALGALLATALAATALAVRGERLLVSAE